MDYWSTESEDGLMWYGLLTWTRCADCVTSSPYRCSCCALHYSAVCAEAAVEHQQSGLLSVVQLLREINAGYLCVMERLLSIHKLFVQFCGFECISRRTWCIGLCGIRRSDRTPQTSSSHRTTRGKLRNCNLETKMRGFTTYTLTSAWRVLPVGDLPWPLLAVWNQ